MAYPDGIDTFPPRVTDDPIPVEDYDNQNDSIVAIETELGALPKGAKADVKTRLNDVDTAIDGKVAKAGDTMSGNLTLDDGTADSPDIIFKNTTDPSSNKIFGDGAKLRLESDSGIVLGTSSTLIMEVRGGLSKVNFAKPIDMNSQAISGVGGITISGANHFINNTAGKGLIMRTPDGTKRYIITVDNAGGLVSTLE